MENQPALAPGLHPVERRLQPLLRLLRRPAVALTLGILPPVIVFQSYGIALTYLPAFLGLCPFPQEQSWLTLTTNPIIVFQQLLVLASGATLIWWLCKRSSSPFMVASLTGYWIVAVLVGVVTAPLSTYMFFVDRSGPWKPAFAFVAPWLVAASFGACALEAHRLHRRIKVTRRSSPT